MNLAFDTSVLIDLEKGKAETINAVNELRMLYSSPVFISFATCVEFLYGIKERSVKNKDKARAFLEKFVVLHTTNRTADIIVDLQAKYEFPLADLFIAAQAIENNFLLVTKDRDFETIKEVQKIIIENN